MSTAEVIIPIMTGNSESVEDDLMWTLVTAQPVIILSGFQYDICLRQVTRGEIVKVA